MAKYIFKRIVMLIPIIIGVVFIVFVLNELSPGDPARVVAGNEATEEYVAELRESMGLNRPFFVRFFDYLIGVFTRGDLGTSYLTKQPVFNEVMERFPTTLLLTLVSMVFTLGLGIPTGIISATRQYSWIDNLCTSIGLIGVSMPNFWQGLMNILIFAVWLEWFPPSGFYGWEYWVLPAFTIGTSSAAQIMRMTRSSMLDVVRQDYICAARAKGLSESKVINKHAMKNALIPILTVIGMDFGTSLGGAVITESVFSIPGLGKYMLDAIKSRDYPVVQGGVLILAIMFSLVTLAVDIAYAFVDPRLKSQYKSTAKRIKKKDAAAMRESA